MSSLLSEDLFHDMQASLTRTRAPHALFDALALYAGTPNPALGQLADDLATDSAHRARTTDVYESAVAFDRLQWLSLAAGSSNPRTQAAWGMYGAFTATRLPVIGAPSMLLPALLTAIQAAAEASGGTSRGLLHLRALTIHNASAGVLDFRAAPSESGGGALAPLLLWRLMVALAFPTEPAARRNAASMADFIAGRSPETPESDCLRHVATQLRTEPGTTVEVGFMAAFVRSFAASDWLAAAEEAQRLSLRASDASLAVNWSVLAALCFVKAQRHGAELEHTAQVILARCSALRPVPSAVKAWAVELLAASQASQGRLHDLVTTVATSSPTSPTDFLESVPRTFEVRELAHWLVGSALLLDAAQTATATAPWLPWAHALAGLVTLTLPASVPAPTGDESLLADALLQAHRQPSLSTGLLPLEQLAQRYEPARELLHRLRARMRRQDSPATRSLVAALRARQWSEAKGTLQAGDELVFTSTVRDALLQHVEVDAAEVVRLLPSLYAAFGNHTHLTGLLEQLADQILPSPDAFGTILLLPHSSMSDELRDAWSGACISFGRQTPPDRLRSLALATCLTDPTRMATVARALALHPEPGAALQALASLADRSDGDALAGVLRAWLQALSDGPDRVNVAQRLLLMDARDTEALHIALDWAQRQSNWEDAVRIQERIGRSTSDPQKRARIYLAIADVLEKHLDNLNGALENTIVSFICDPSSAETLAVLERLYRSQKKYRDLLATYDTVIEVCMERGDTDRASDLWARRAQVAFQALQRPEEAARSLLEAIRLRPGSQKLVELMVKSVAPAAGGTWAEQAQALHRAAQA